MKNFSSTIQARLKQIGDRHSARELLAEQFLRMALERGYSIHDAGNGYIGINAPTGSKSLRVFHVTNAGRLSVLYYMLDGALSKSRSEMQSLLKNAGLALRLVKLDKLSAQETVDFPQKKETWINVGTAMANLANLLKGS